MVSSIDTGGAQPYRCTKIAFDQKRSSGETLFQPLPIVYKSLLNILLFVGVFVFVSICSYVKRVAVAHAADNIFSPRHLSSSIRNLRV